jgi:hypothetical protein
VAETACTPARQAAGLLDFFVEKKLLVSRVYGDFSPKPRVGRLSHFDGDDSERPGARVPRIQVIAAFLITLHVAKAETRPGP